MTIAEVEAAFVALRTSLSDEPPPDRSGLLRILRDLHLLLVRVTPSSTSPPVDCLQAAAALAADVSDDIADALAPRPRTVCRLLRAGAWPAVWELLAENAVGVVEEDFTASTATGTPRATSRLPLLTRIEAPTVFAELPGFRDPRYDVPDACYDITGTISLRHGVDEVVIESAALVLSGWAALDILATDPAEVVSLVAQRTDGEIAVAGRRIRRADLVTGRGEALTRRAWAGWSARLDLADPRLRPGSWLLSLQLDHGGVRRKVPLGREATALAAAAVAASMPVGRRTFGVKTVAGQWQLVVPAAN
jgi:hypothetical protein